MYLNMHLKFVLLRTKAHGTVVNIQGGTGDVEVR